MFVFTLFVSRTSFTNVVLLFFTYITVEQVAQTKSTARPMITEELAAAGLPAEPEVQNPKTAQLPEEHSSSAASGSRTQEDGEVRSEDEEVGDVDADVKDLIAARPSGPLPPSFVFGESKVTTNMIRDYEAVVFFPAGTGRAPLDEQTPTPEDGEVVVFLDFFTCGLRFPCDPIFVVILDTFSVKIHQLSPNSFLEVSKFIWIMRTFGCNFGADAFARFFELVIVLDVIKVDDGQFYKAHYTCCTFNTRQQNSRRGITRIQIAPCCKTNFTEDRSSYWFYVKVDMSTIPNYEGPAHPLSSPIEVLTAVCTADYNHRAVGIRSCENAFHLASTILGGSNISGEFVAARIWPISYGWTPTEIVNFNVNWAAQEVPFPKFGLQLRDGQSADDFMLEIEWRMNLIIGGYTMNEYKAYKNLVKRKKRINRVFSEVCGDKSLRSRRPGPKLKMPVVAVASCSAAPLKAPRRRSSKSSLSIADETTSSSVQPSKTKSLESSNRKRKSSEQVSVVELQAASNHAQMSRKKAKKAIKKVVSSEVQRVPSAFDDDLFAESSQKGSLFWPLLRFNFHEHCPSGSENEFVDIDSFSDVAPEVQKEVVSAAAAEPPAATIDTIVSHPVLPQDEASPEFTKEIELIIHRGENPVQDAPLVEIREDLPEGHAPSPSLAAFNKIFGTSYHGELLSVGCEAAGTGGGTSTILKLWKLSTLVTETGEGASEQTSCLPRETARDSRKRPCTSLKRTSTSSEQALVTKDKKGAPLLQLFSL
jgi:hypothetical protein